MTNLFTSQIEEAKKGCGESTGIIAPMDNKEGFCICGKIYCARLILCKRCNELKQAFLQAEEVCKKELERYRNEPNYVNKCDNLEKEITKLKEDQKKRVEELFGKVDKIMFLNDTQKGIINIIIEQILSSDKMKYSHALKGRVSN